MGDAGTSRRSAVGGEAHLLLHGRTPARHRHSGPRGGGDHPEAGHAAAACRNAGTWYRRVEKTGHQFDYICPPTEIDEIAANVRLLAELAEFVHIAFNTNTNSQGPIDALALAEALQLSYRNPDLLAEFRTAVGLPLDR
jgi:hypothetical protein